MKLIHTADLHLGSPFGELSDTAKKIRKAELVQSFRDLVTHASENGFRHVLLSGDIFDSDKVNKADKEFFYDIIENHPEITFFYLRGNHDSKSRINREDLANLKTFSDEWKSFRYGNVVISGIELGQLNSTILYDTLNLEKDDFNIVMIHGQVAASISNPLVDIRIQDFCNKHIDYIALGHVHTMSQNALDRRGVYVYPGCLEGRGFDETGTKGFFEIDTDTKEYLFRPFAKREVFKVEADLSGTHSEFAACSAVDAAISQVPASAVIQVVLTGKVDFDCSNLKHRLESAHKHSFLFFEVKTKVFQEVKLEDYLCDLSLRGEVVREVLRRDFDEETKNEILSNCLSLLNGEDLEV